MTPRGEWQREFLRELAEMGYSTTFEDIVNQVNSYDDQLTDQVWEGATAQGREHLRKLIRAGNALSKRALRQEQCDLNLYVSPGAPSKLRRDAQDALSRVLAESRGGCTIGAKRMTQALRRRGWKAQVIYGSWHPLDTVDGRGFVTDWSQGVGHDWVVVDLTWIVDPSVAQFDDDTAADIQYAHV
jgi:hypothetical protein